MSYYNTTKESPQTVMDFTEKNLKQDERIYRLMKQNPDRLYGASDLKVIFPNMPLTSIRRALNTLTNKKMTIERTSMKQKGYFNANEYLYRYK